MRALAELGVPHYHHEFAKKLLRRAVEGTAGDRESASGLFEQLTGGCEAIISKESIAQGFDRLLEVLDDLRLDTPNAEQILGSLRSRWGLVPGGP